jgi:hypothetical protein
MNIEGKQVFFSMHSLIFASIVREQCHNTQHIMITLSVMALFSDNTHKYNTMHGEKHSFPSMFMTKKKVLLC